MMLGAKFQDDKKLANIEFGKIGGISNKELNLLEVNFLETIGFNLWVSSDMYNGYLQQILSADANYVRKVNLTAVELSRKESDEQNKQNSCVSDSDSTSDKVPEESTPAQDVETPTKEQTAIGVN